METLTAHLIEALALISFEFIAVWSFVWSDEFEILLDDCRVLADDISILAELQVVSFALQGAELVKMLSVFHWEKVFISCFAGCLHLEPFSICAISLVFLSVWKLSSFWMRLGLSMCRKRKRNRVQSKKRWSNIARRKHLERKLNNKGHLFLFLILSNGYGVFGMDAQQFGQFMQGFSTLLNRQEAFIQGMANTMGAGSSSSTVEASAVAKSLESASRILKTPDFFDATDSSAWVSWRHSFMNWLGYADSPFLESLRDIEKLAPTEEVETADWSQSDWDLAHKLYAALTSYLRGSALQLSRSGAEDRNGYALWKSLVDHYSPATRQRALALSQAISSFPSYKAGSDKSLQEHIMSMEMLVQQYDSLSSKAFDRDVLLGVLLRLCPDAVRQHLTLSISDATSYAEVRERILACERTCRLWNVEDILKPLNKPRGPAAIDPNAMEVDAVMFKGKGGQKGKGKQKGKGRGDWFNAWNWAGRWSKGGKSKGKPTKGKGKQKGKSKGKGKQPKCKGKAKGKLSPDRCRICGEWGHWGNECPQREVRFEKQVARQVDRATLIQGHHQAVQQPTALSVVQQHQHSVGYVVFVCTMWPLLLCNFQNAMLCQRFHPMKIGRQFPLRFEQ